MRNPELRQARRRLPGADFAQLQVLIWARHAMYADMRVREMTLELGFLLIGVRANRQFLQVRQLEKGRQITIGNFGTTEVQYLELGQVDERPQRPQRALHLDQVEIPQMSQGADRRDVRYAVDVHQAQPCEVRQSFQRRDRLVIEDRKSTRLNSSHDQISYAVFC